MIFFVIGASSPWIKTEWTDNREWNCVPAACCTVSVSFLLLFFCLNYLEIILYFTFLDQLITLSISETSKWNSHLTFLCQADNPFYFSSGPLKLWQVIMYLINFYWLWVKWHISISIKVCQCHRQEPVTS